MIGTDNVLVKIAETESEKDLRLWRTWKSAVGFAKEQALNELLAAMKGPIGTAVNTYRSAPMPGPTMELEARRYAVKAFQDFDPVQSLNLASFVITRVKQDLFRYVGTYQNAARIPEAGIRLIGPMREAHADLSQRYGRDPTTEELADHMRVPVAHVVRLRRSLRADLLDDSGEETGPTLDSMQHDPNFERAMLAYYSMNNEEKQVFDFSLGAHGQPRLKPGEIAKRLKLTSVRLSQLKSRMADKLAPYVGT
jgi:RNA polymerase primary sigma factor